MVDYQLIDVRKVVSSVSIFLGAMSIFIDIAIWAVPPRSVDDLVGMWNGALCFTAGVLGMFTPSNRNMKVQILLGAIVNSSFSVVSSILAIKYSTDAVIDVNAHGFHFSYTLKSILLGISIATFFISVSLTYFTTNLLKSKVGNTEPELQSQNSLLSDEEQPPQPPPRLESLSHESPQTLIELQPDQLPLNVANTTLQVAQQDETPLLSEHIPFSQQNLDIIIKENETTDGPINGRKPRVEKKVLEIGIKKLVQSKNAKFHEIIDKLESQVNIRQLDHLLVEKCYVETTLKTWLDESIQKAFECLEKETERDDSSAKLSTLWNQLDSIQLLKNVSNLEGKSSKLLEWCSGERLQLIIGQSDVFESTRMSINLVSNYFKKFKEACTRKILSQWLNDKNYAKQHRHFIRKLNKFLSFINADKRRREILAEIFLKNQLNVGTGQELVQNLTKLCQKYYLLDNDRNEMVADKPALPPAPVLDFMNSATELSTENWTVNFQSLTKEMCKRQLLPTNTTVEYKMESGRRMVIIKGVVVFVSEVKEEMLQLKKEHNVEEIHIVGLSSIHVDCNLERENWHGANVSVVTDKLLVDKEVCWDVSGEDSSALQNTATAGRSSGIDVGKTGDNGEAGESGGNMYVICRKIVNGQQWAIVSNGGHGSNGQDGVDEQDEKELGMEPREWKTKEEFHQEFPSMSSKSSVPFKAARKADSAMKTVLKTLEKKIDRCHRQYGADVGADYDYGDFFVQCKANKVYGGTTVSFYGAKKERHTLILWKGNEEHFTPILRDGKGGRGGQGGYRGTIIMENMAGKPLEMKLFDDINEEESYQMATAVIIRSNRDGSDGADGQDGNNYVCQSEFSNARDFGFIDRGDKSFKPVYYGFDKDEQLTVNYYSEKPSYPYVLCMVPGLDDRQYAKIEVVEDSQRIKIGKPSKFSSQRVQRETVKKKAITRQSLDQYVAQIIERKTIGEIIKETTAFVPLEQQLNDSNQLMSNELTHDQREDCNLNGELRELLLLKRITKSVRVSAFTIIKKTEGGRPAYDVYDLTNNCGSSYCACNLCRTKWGNKRNVRINPQVCLEYLDRIRTRKDVAKKTLSVESFNYKVASTYRTKQFALRVKDNDRDFPLASAKKNEFFQFETDRLWKMTTRIQNELKKEIVKSENQKLMNLIDCHYQPGEASLDGKVSFMLSRYLKGSDNNEDRNVEIMWNKVLTSCGDQLQKAVSFLVFNLNKRYSWEEFYTLSDDWKCEYRKSFLLKSCSWMDFLETLNKDSYHLFHKDYINIHNDRNLEYGNEDRLTFSHSLYPESGRFREQHFLICAEDGNWQRLELNPKLKKFLDDRAHQAAIFRQNYKKEYHMAETSITVWHFQEFVNWFQSTCPNANQQIVTSILMLDPEYGETPVELFHLLWFCLTLSHGKQMDECCAKDMERLATYVGSLAERVVDYNIRNIDPIFYLHAVANFCPHRWKYEFLLLEMEERMLIVLQPEERGKWREALSKLSDRMVSILQDRLMAFIDSDDDQTSSSFLKNQLDSILTMLAEYLEFTEDDMEQFSRLPLNDWLFDLQIKLFEKHLSPMRDEEDAMKEAVYMKLVETESKKEIKHLDEFRLPPNRNMSHILTNAGTIFQKNQKISSEIPQVLGQSGQERNFQEIIYSMEENGYSSSRVTFHLPQIKQMVSSSFNFPNRLVALKVDDSWSGQFETINDITLWAKQLNVREKKRRRSKRNKVSETENAKLFPSDYLYVYDRAVQLVFPKREANQNFRLLDTQRVAIITLLTNKSSALAQISTGEGKSLVVAGVAIYRALTGQKVDVITSNNMLAVRDSTLPAFKGGLVDLYAVFDISVGNNCSQVVDDRVKAYDSPVVYGELSNFQRDYLLHEFYGRNILGDRKIAECYVIVDEVDCMLLDRGNNMLYLSHDIPGMEMLESLYVFVWEKICISNNTLDEIKSAVLYDLYGVITKNDLMSVHASLKSQPGKLNAIWAHLIEHKVVDHRGRLLIKDMEEFPETGKNCFDIENLKIKLVYFFRQVAERQRRIRIPDHLMSFVDCHLHTWLGNAWRALHEFKLDTDYVVSQDWTGTSLDANPQVIIIDSDTGTDQVSSQWDGALHQFLQLKEGCQISLQSLKAVFISNVNYIKKYKRLYGVSGTLGSKREKEFLRETYECFYFTIPTAFSRAFDTKPAQVLKTEVIWLEAITSETRRTVLSCPENMERPRSILIFCQSINSVNIVYVHLKKVFETELSSNQVKIHRYTRSYQKFPYEINKLDVGHIIVATNLAGRGTDIKISQQLRENGGLHICLTYLPENERVEEQAMGRAGRQGDPGSGILILCQPNKTAQEAERNSMEWGGGKIFEMKIERNRQESQRLSRLTQDFLCNINKQELGFQAFSEHYKKLAREMVDRQCDEQTLKAVCDSALDQWALWLDSVDKDLNFRSLPEEMMLKRLNKDLIDKQKLPEKTSELVTWMTPARSVALAKFLATRKQKRGSNSDVNLSKLSIHKAIELLDKVIQSEEGFFQPAAHYYRIFTFLKANENSTRNRNEFLKMARMTDTILDRHIEMQTSFSQIVAQTLEITSTRSSNNNSSWYKLQKENNIKILEYFLSSVRSLLGTHNFTTWDLQLEAGVDADRVDEYFHKLVTSGCIVCQVNDVDTVPDYETSIQKIADTYGVDPLWLTLYLENSDQNLSEEETEGNLCKTNVIQCTRERFWRTLVKVEALQRLPQTIRPRREEDGLSDDDGTDCLIVSQSELNKKPLNRLNRKNNIDIDYMSSNSEFKPILYSPTYVDGSDLESQNKIMFSKSYVQEILSTEEYRRTEKLFELNKIACLNLTKLAMVDPKTLGQLKMENLRRIKINESEWQHIWQALIDQNIIDSEGYLLSENGDDREFIYSECPMYEIPVAGLIKKTFAAELVRRQWMNSKEDVERLKSIISLPLEPYRDMLSDFHVAHIISGSGISDNLKIDDLKRIVKKIAQNIVNTSKEERDRIVSLLRSRQSAFSAKEKPKASLLPIERVVREKNDKANISTELYIFGLVGFDHVIEISEGKWPLKMILKAAAILAIGVAQLLVSGAIIFLKVVGFVDNLGFGKSISFMNDNKASWVPKLAGPLPLFSFLKEGISDIAFAIEKLTAGHDFSWGDYRRRKLTSLKNTFQIGEESWKFIQKRILKEEVTEVNTNQQVPPIEPTRRWVKMNDTRIKIIKGMTLGLSYQQVESLVYSQLTALCNKLEKDLFEEAIKTFENHAITFKRPYKPLTGVLETERLFNEKMQKITSTWVKEGETYMSAMLMANFTKKTNEALEKSQMASKHTENQIVEMSSVLITTTKNILENELMKTLIQKLADKCAENQFNIERVDIKNVKCQFKDAVTKLMNPWSTKLLENTARQIIDMAARDIDNETFTDPGGSDDNWKEILKSKRRQSTGKLQSDRQNAISSSFVNEAHVTACLKMMKERRDPKLFVAFIRENVLIPADPFCAHALSCALSASAGLHDSNPIRKSNNTEVFLRIESFDEVLFDNRTDPSSDNNLFVAKVNRVLGNQPKSNVYISTEDGEGVVCMFDCFAKQVAKRFPQMVQFNGDKLREMVAVIIEKNAAVSAAIRNGWHSHTMRIGLFGMMGERNYQRKKKEPYSKNNDEINRREVYQHIGYAHIEQYAKHEGVKKICRHEHPVIKIRYHHKPQKLSGKEKVKEYRRLSTMSFEDEEESSRMCEETGLCQMETFNNIQKCYLERGDYKSAIWNSIETYLIPIIEKQEEILKREEYISAALKHFEAYSKLERVAGNGKCVITEEECIEMKKRLIVFTPNLRVSQGFLKTMVTSIYSKNHRA